MILTKYINANVEVGINRDSRCISDIYTASSCRETEVIDMSRSVFECCTGKLNIARSKSCIRPRKGVVPHTVSRGSSRLQPVLKCHGGSGGIDATDNPRSCSYRISAYSRGSCEVRRC